MDTNAPQKHKDDIHVQEHSKYSLELCASIVWITASSVLIAALVLTFQPLRLPQLVSKAPAVSSNQCYKTCSIEIVESIPQNLSFDGIRPTSTFDVWHELITNAKHSLAVAAYKSSLRGKHVFGQSAQGYSYQGEIIYEALREAGLDRGVDIRMVENGPSKDRGDNEDGRSLERLGALQRRTLNLRKLFSTGTMHSKFILADNKDFYLGSANLDWRSLNQKMEHGVFVKNCPCLAQDLSVAFETYWRAAKGRSVHEVQIATKKLPELRYSRQKPLRVQHERVNTDIYIATSPKMWHSPTSTWDLDAIAHELGQAKDYALIHVMDYFPMFLYSQNRRFWPRLDNAIREAIMRGVHVRIIAAALHYPSKGLRFLKSLEAMNDITPIGSIDIRIFKVPTADGMEKVMRRERRTHKKFLVTDEAVIIGTSNWSGDYFEGPGTGAAIVVRQNATKEGQPFITRMKLLFERDWSSQYTHSLDEYFEGCILSDAADFCETEKDRSFLAHTPATNSTS